MSDPQGCYYDSSTGNVHAPVDFDTYWTDDEDNNSRASDSPAQVVSPNTDEGSTRSESSSLPHHLAVLRERRLLERTTDTAGATASPAAPAIIPAAATVTPSSGASRASSSGATSNSGGPTYKHQITEAGSSRSILRVVDGVVAVAVVPPSPPSLVSSQEGTATMRQVVATSSSLPRSTSSPPTAVVEVVPNADATVESPQQQQLQPSLHASFTGSEVTESEQQEDEQTLTTTAASKSGLAVDNSVTQKGDNIETESQQGSGRKKRIIRAGLGVLAIVVVAGTVAVATVLSVNRASKASMTKLETIRSRGQLHCGILASDDGSLDSVGEGTSLVGFSIDLCNAIAAAIFQVSTNKRSLIPVSTSSRFQALANDTVDVLISSTTHTMERQIYEPMTKQGYSFSIPYLYGGLTFGGVPPFGKCADQRVTGISALLDCRGLSVCVVESTTFARDVPNILKGNYTLKVLPNMDAFYTNFIRGNCNALAGDQFETSPATVKASGYFGEYEVGQNFYSKEPLAMVTRQDDSTWSDFVSWTIQGLIGAEEQGITQARSSLFTESDVFGEEYRYMFIDAIKEVGHYGELYARRLQGIVPRKLVNTINNGTSETGLIYAMPMGEVGSEGTSPVVGGTLNAIRERGFLRCGIARGIFSILNSTTEKYVGFDVDFCRALSAAIFGGITETIVYSDLNPEDRFVALNNGEVDVLSRITTVTLIRDVLEPTSNGSFSFSQPDFYDGVQFGGIPPFGLCANGQDTGETNNPECSDLKICVAAGSTTVDIIKGLFPEKFIVSMQSSELAVQGLASGACNAIAGGVGEIVESNIRVVGQYLGEYEIGSRRFSKDPLALVTRQNDPEWSAFVYWIVSAIFHAEEQGITAASSHTMPIVNLFGYLYQRMFRDAIAAVGSYKEIYDRNLEAVLPRSGLNLQNMNPLGPQHYPMPGLGE